MSCEVCMKGYRISLIRHGLTEANEKGIYIGRTDLPLSAKGESELCSKMEEFEYPHVHRVYSSPLRRCTETADILFPSVDSISVKLLSFDASSLPFAASKMNEPKVEKAHF